MKKIFSLLCLMALVLTSLNTSASSPKKVLLEGFTSSSCSPCAQMFPTWDANVVQALDVLIPIKYHTSWPLPEDPMYTISAAVSSTRTSYYSMTAVPGYCKAGAVVEMTEANIENWYNPALNHDELLAATSPITLEITQVNQGQTVNVSVKVSSDNELAGQMLRVALVEPIVYYEGANGITEHEWVVRTMLPNAQGSVLTLAAGASTTVELSTTLAAALASKNLYVVAFVQDDASKDVMQAATNIDSRQAIAKVTTVQSQADGIPRNGFRTKVATVKNDGNFTETFALTATQLNDDVDCTVSLDKTSVTLEPGASEDITLNVNAGANAFYTSIYVVATPQSNERFAVADAVTFDFLTNDAKYAVYYGYGNTTSFAYEMMKADERYNKDLVYIPQYSDIFTRFNPTQFDLAIIGFNANNYSSFISGIGSRAVVAAEDMLDAGKRVLFTAEFGMSLFNRTDISVAAAIKNFARERINTSGATALARYTADANGNVTAIKTFTLNGFSSDPIGSSINSITCNQYSQAYPYFNLINEALETETNELGNITPFCYYDGDQTKIAGVKGEYAAGRLVYTSFGFDAISNTTTRNTVIDNIITWLLSDVSDLPTIQVSNDYIDFGEVLIGETAAQEITITNNGSQPLVIDRMEYDGADEFTMSLPENISLGLGDSYTLTIGYTPTNTKDSYGTLTIYSNATLAPEFYISFEGIGVSEQEMPTAVLSENALDFGEIEVMETKELTIKLSNTGNGPLTVQSITFSMNNPAVFEVTQGGDAPYTLEAGDSEDLVVLFQPFAAVQYTGVLDIQTNDPKNQIMQVNLTGLGKEDPGEDGVKEVSAQNGNFTMRVLPNPVSAQGSIEFSALNNPMNVELSVMDAAGRIVNSIYSANAIIGNVSIPLNVNNYANGFYTIIGTINGEQVNLPLIIRK